MPGLNIDLDIEGLELLADAYANAPEQVIAAADRAGLRAVRLLRPSIRRETPEVSGFLRRSESVRLEDHFNVVFRAGAPYASFVQRHNDFVTRGTERVESQVDAIYDAEFDRMAETFGSGT